MEEGATERAFVVVVTFGTFDLLHVGHTRILQRARALGNVLHVGVSTDEFTLQKKGRAPIYTLDERKELLKALSCVDTVFDEESMDAKRRYLEDRGAHVLVMGSDWTGAFDDVAPPGCRVVYLERTEGISTTDTIARIRHIVESGT